MCWYIRILRILTKNYITALTTKQVVKKVIFYSAYSILINKDDLTKQSAITKQVLKQNGYQESITCKFLKIITNNHSLSQSRQQAQATDIQEEEMGMSINLAYAEGTSEKLWCIFRSYKTRSTVYTESTLCKLLSKLKVRGATEDKNMIVYETDCSNCKIGNHLQMNTKDQKIAILKRMKLPNSVWKHLLQLQ